MYLGSMSPGLKPPEKKKSVFWKLGMITGSGESIEGLGPSQATERLERR